MRARFRHFRALAPYKKERGERVADVSLGRQEQRLLDLLADTGWSNQQIADELGRSVNTIRTQIGTLCLKAGVRTRAALVAWEWERRLERERGRRAPTRKKG